MSEIDHKLNNNTAVRNALKECVKRNVIRKRTELGWSQSELSRRAGVTRSSLSIIENGKRLPYLVTLCKICHALDCALEDIVGLRYLSEAMATKE
jgi:transcriptional regulator with XRE-family HTH domain